MKDKKLELLAEIQLLLPAVLLQRLKDGTATAAEMRVARDLLKDNDITATEEANPGLTQLKLNLPEIDEYGREVG